MVEEEKNHFFTEKTTETLSQRLQALFKDLPPHEVRNALEELFDDYAYGVYGTSVLHEMRKVRLAGKGKCVSIQTLAKGRAMLVSAYGFKVVSESQCKCGRGFLVLDELNHEDRRRERQELI